MSMKKPRPSPSESVTAFPVGTRRKGGDGGMWETKAASNGVQSWVKVKEHEAPAPRANANAKAKAK